MASISLDEVKIYLHVDSDVENALIESQMSAADRYISGKISKTQVYLSTGEDGIKVYGPIADDSLYQQCIKLMVAHWYENREASTDLKLSEVPFAVEAILNRHKVAGIA